MVRCRHSSDLSVKVFPSEGSAPRQWTFAGWLPEGLMAFMNINCRPGTAQLDFYLWKKREEKLLITPALIILPTSHRSWQQMASFTMKCCVGSTINYKQ